MGVHSTDTVLPVWMEADLVEKLDEAWRRQGWGSRMELFRVALQRYFAQSDEPTIAEMLESLL